jgi:hypothetical protein
MQDDSGRRLHYSQLVPGDVLITSQRTAAWMVIAIKLNEPPNVIITVMKLWDNGSFAFTRKVYLFDYPNDAFIFSAMWGMVITSDGRTFKRFNG